MAIDIALSEIANYLRQGRFPNEQAVSQGIVLRILRELGWDSFDVGIVWPEYQTGEGRVDFALCHPPLKPLVFIEVKQPGKAEDAVRQALEYAFHTGVPFVVLTDGRTWSFYLPAEQGSYEDRRVFKLDLFERSPTEAAETLRRYLDRARVEAGKVLEDARAEYRNRTHRTQAKAAIPAAWKELVERGEELLLELLADATELKSGIRPDEKDLANFLSHLTSEPLAMAAGSTSAPSAVVRSGLFENPGNGGGETQRHGSLVVQGERIAYRNAKEAMVIVLKKFADNDPSFLPRLARRDEMRGRKRRYIGRSPQELYPDRNDLWEFNERLPGGWYVSTNLNNNIKRVVIKAATEVAGMTFGSDVNVDL